jgi:hypothetical protein
MQGQGKSVTHPLLFLSFTPSTTNNKLQEPNPSNTLIQSSFIMEMENQKVNDPYFFSFTPGQSTITSSSSILNLNQHAIASFPSSTLKEH